MISTEEVVQKLREFKQEQGNKFGIEEMNLFGSVARGEQTESSDIDVCVRLKRKTFRIYMSLKEELEKLFNTKVDLLTLHENMRQMFRQNIERDAIYI